MDSSLSRVLLALALLFAACGSEPSPPAAQQRAGISGHIDAGLRVLQIDPSATDQQFTIYRGDYVRPELAGGGPFTLEIPDLGVNSRFPAPEGESPYFKVPDAGRFEFRSGSASGTIEAIELRSASYTEVNAHEAAELIANVDPLILDVRTPREFQAGHLEGARLIPVQVLRDRMGELGPPSGKPVLIYCRSGNRSTVAARMLLDAGFTRIANMRHGIAEWNRAGLPITE